MKLEAFVPIEFHFLGILPKDMDLYTCCFPDYDHALNTESEMQGIFIK